MSLVIKNNNALIEKLLTNKLHIAFFVHRGQYYWVVDWDEHFNLDYKKNIDAICSDVKLMQYLPKGTTIKEHYKTLLANYRSGISQLTEDNFTEYLDIPDVRVLSTTELASLFFSEKNFDYTELNQKIEKFISFGNSISDKYLKMLNRLRTLLPTFYINFDRKIYLHMRIERVYEKVVYTEWYGDMLDFEHMIPVLHRYWCRDINEDFWGITNFKWDFTTLEKRSQILS